LITLETTYENGFLFVPQISLDKCIIRDNFFIGNMTSLIYLFKGLLSVSNSVAIGNGYLQNLTVLVKDKSSDTSIYFPYESY
jgi:hypothetical protein